ncbi:MAG: hypothetical protein NTW21_18650 [Verrucomicrobia bacterium]|nr:hypothetical protein [Verrucomicrobiota bacterium]
MKMTKLTKYLAGFSALALATTTYADVTVNITGATAFRAATLQSIKAKYAAATTPLFKFAHDQATAGGTTYTGATRAIFIGNFPGVSGTTTVRCCFTGSVEGIRALVPVTDPLPPTYYPSSVLAATTATAGGAELANAGSAGLATDTSHIAFSDVSKAATPYSGYSLLPASPNAGVIVFTMLTNEGSTITNVTSQQFRALLTNGYQPLSLFTGNAGDTTNVFATGRNDGSGTRTTYLAETGFGIANAVKQYVTNESTSTTLTTIQLVPAGGLNAPALTGQSASNASTVWGQDVAGNGGYNSGSTLRTDMGKTGASVTVLDETGADAFGGPVRADLVTWLSVSDAVSARGNGAAFCAYNGVKLDDIAASGSTMSAADKAKVTEGRYTAWGYERMYRRNDITSGDALTVYDAIKAAIPANLGSAGIALTDMHVGRATDGGVIGSNN